jgi:hypothetical protein
MAIGSLPYTNGRYGQRTYILFGKALHSYENKTIVLRMFLHNSNLVSTGFIVSGAGFLVSSCGDLNKDGLPDVLLSQYFNWVHIRSPSYTLILPRNVTTSPTPFPSSTPSMLPTSSPSITPSHSVSSPTTPSVQQETHVPTRSPTITPTYIPSLSPTTEIPTIFRTHTPVSTLTPTISRSRPKDRPTILSHSKDPSFSPTFFTNFTDIWNVIYCQESGSCVGKNGNNKFFITGSGDILIIANSTGKNIFYLYPVENTVVIDGYSAYKDSFEFLGFTEISSIQDVSYSSDPLTLYFQGNQFVVVTNLQTINQLNTSSIKFQERSKSPSKIIDLQFLLLLGGLAIVTMIIFAMSIIGKYIGKDEIDKYHDDESDEASDVFVHSNEDSSNSISTFDFSEDEPDIEKFFIPHEFKSNTEGISDEHSVSIETKTSNLYSIELSDEIISEFSDLNEMFSNFDEKNSQEIYDDLRELIITNQDNLFL